MINSGSFIYLERIINMKYLQIFVREGGGNSGEKLNHILLSGQMTHMKIIKEGFFVK